MRTAIRQLMLSDLRTVITGANVVTDSLFEAWTQPELPKVQVVTYGQRPADIQLSGEPSREEVDVGVMVTVAARPEDLAAELDTLGDQARAALGVFLDSTQIEAQWTGTTAEYDLDLKYPAARLIHRYRIVYANPD